MILNKLQSNQSPDSLDAEQHNPSDSLASASNSSFVTTPTLLALVFGALGLVNVLAALMAVSMTTLHISFGEAYMTNMLTISSILFPLALTLFIGKVVWNLLASARH